MYPACVRATAALYLFSPVAVVAADDSQCRIAM
jgi:hypothetical protein